MRKPPPLHLKHGHTVGSMHTRVYSCWHGIIQRCTNPKASGYRRYGGRGIQVCDRWRESFDNFLADMGDPPTPAHSIDRYPDKDGHYEPGNCRWATPKEQGNNTNANRLLTYDGRTQTLSQWADELGVKQNTLNYRLRRGWTLERAFLQKTQTHTYAHR